MKRKSRLQIPVTDEELKKIHQKALDCGMSDAMFCRFILLKSEINVEVIE